MNIIISVPISDYDKFTKNKKGKTICKLYDKKTGKYYYDVDNMLDNLKIGNVVFLFMYGYCKYYFIVRMIQFDLLKKGCRLYFDEIFENKDWKGTRINNFKGIKWIK